MVGLADKDNKTAIINTPHLFQDGKEKHDHNKKKK